ncbi:MAG: flagellin lysine-N-methylase [Clostridia bacterium]|nr:flagellin lysine-N-methylase [Clostridia bacterium]
MSIYVPNYYKAFRCIADRCRHSCCIGWEIDIDKETLSVYKNVSGAFGKRLNDNISQEDTPHFILGEQERCPFLNERNLCDIYTELGEEHLCQICSDHPRFRNFFENRTEIGLGMCCEAAAELILTFPEKMKLVHTETDEKTPFFPEREQAFAILQNRSQPIKERIRILKETFGITLPEKTFSEWKEVFLSMEILNSRWEALLKNATGVSPAFQEDKWQIAKEQLLVYFVFRHMMPDGDASSALALCLVSYEMILRLCKTEADLFDVARMYSAEMEYCEENTEDLLFEIEIG